LTKKNLGAQCRRSRIKCRHAAHLACALSRPRFERASPALKNGSEDIAGVLIVGLIAFSVRHHRHARDRRGRLLQSGRVQRRPCARHEGHARLHGGKLNKAQKGELHFALPVGFVFDDLSWPLVLCWLA
jgi:hypothetical protein